LANGDSIILMIEGEDGKFEEKERRRVNMVLSARSCGLEEPFTDDIILKCEFWVQRKPKLREQPKSIDQIIQERIELAGGGGAATKRLKKDEKDTGMSRE